MTPTMLKLHRWLGLVAGLMILLASGTALALNHRDLWQRPPVPAQGPASPFHKTVLAFAIDPHAPSRVLAGTNDGLYRSLDGGKTWEEAVLPVPAEQVGAIQFDPRQPGTVYLALRGIGVFVSTDHGDIWEEVGLPFYPPEGHALTGLSLGAKGEVLVATEDSLWLKAGPHAGWVRQGASAAPTADASGGMLRLVHDLHDGRFWGTWGVPLTDAVCLALILLVVTGYGLFVGRLLRRRLAVRRGLTVLRSVGTPTP